MPEGDTVWLAARRMDQAFAGRALTIADLRTPQLATVDLTGRVVHEVGSYGKRMLTRFEDGLTLHTHFRMDGSWRLDRVGSRWRGGPAHHVRVILQNEQWRALGFRLHDIALVPTDEESRLTGHLGPDVLGPDWNAHEAERRIAAAPERAIGEALLDQRNLAGVGNLYENEVLFLTGRTPWTPVAEAGAIEPIVTRVRRMMFANRNHPEQSTTGDLRRGATHWVYGRAGDACLRCGTPIRSARLGPPTTDRIAFWCPRCQTGPAPAVDPPRRRSSLS